MEARGTKNWIVDASAAGQTGLRWRANLGGSKFVTRPGGDEGKVSFVANGTIVRGVEEFRGWVKCTNGLWLPVTDAAGAAGDKASAEAIPSVSKRPVQPVGRSGLGRSASTGKCIPYLHPQGECECGSALCSPKPNLPEPAAAQTFEYSWPAPAPTKTVGKPKPWWTWQHVILVAVLAVLVLVLANREESPDAAYRRRQRVPPLYRALEPFFRGA